MLTQDLQSMKYAELQKLAKSAGIRANQKVDKLIRALTEHYETQATVDGEAEIEDVNGSRMDDSESTTKPVLVSGGTPKEVEKTGKKRRRTFDLEEPTLKGDNTPVIENEHPRVTRMQTSRNTTPQNDTPSQPIKRLRRNTFDKQSPAVEGSSPSTRAILDSINGDCSSAERKEKLLSAIDKRVHLKMASSPSNHLRSQPSQIPRFMAFLTNKKKDDQNSTTPGGKNWNKIHKKEFSKFDSIDVYLEKKQQRKENLSSSTKKQLAKKSPAVRSSSRTSKTIPKGQETSKIFKPTVISTKNINFDFSNSLSDLSKTPKFKVLKPASKEPAKIFKPSVMSTKNINFNFSKSISDSNKTPKSKTTNTPSRKQVSTSAKVRDIGSTTKATPFKFTGNFNTTVTLNTSTSLKKPAFNLKASLAKPLTWKPHTGKLQPVDANATQAVFTSRSVASVPTNNKVRRVVSRDSASRMRPLQAKNVRRAAQLDRRSNQKYVDMMKRRGLMA